MKDCKAAYRYVIVSPVRDEEKYVEATIRAVLKQTIRPVSWVIVDDGSQDKTAAVVKRYAETIPWITLLQRKRGAGRQPASIMQAFAEGYALVQGVDSDFIVKLDCDVELPAHYFESLMKRFEQEDNLGIASGVYLENRGHEWSVVRMPEYHAAGASKMLRKGCFVGIGGFLPVQGWDTIDEIKAQMHGWKTRHFEDLKFYHLKQEGSSVGLLRTNLVLGQIYYLTGGGKLFFLLKLLHRLVSGRPIVLGAAAMGLGFLKPWILRRRQLVSEAEAAFYRRLLNRRIIDNLAKRLDRRRLFRKAWGNI